MVSPRRLLVLPLTALALAGAGCEKKEDAYKEAKTEGVYLRAGGLKYQIQLSRTLNPGIQPDLEYLRGIPASEKAPGRTEEWFGVWLRVENDGKRPHFAASQFEITDSLGKVYEPVDLKFEENPLAYEAREIRPGHLIPDTQTVNGQLGTRGAFLLFKLELSAYQNRPLEFVIKPPADTDAKTELDL